MEKGAIRWALVMLTLISVIAIAWILFSASFSPFGSPTGWYKDEISAEEAETVERLLRFWLEEYEEIDLMRTYSGRDSTVRVFVTGIEDADYFLGRFGGIVETQEIGNFEDYKDRYGVPTRRYLVRVEGWDKTSTGMIRHVPGLYADFVERGDEIIAFILDPYAEAELINMVVRDGNAIKPQACW